MFVLFVMHLVYPGDESMSSSINCLLIAPSMFAESVGHLLGSCFAQLKHNVVKLYS